MTKIILYIATSQDGFIADKNGGVDWLPHPQPEDKSDEFGYQALMQKISTILMGSVSYQQILSFGAWAWPEKKTYVFSAQALRTNQAGIFFVHEKLKDAAKHLKTIANNQDIWLLGGAKLAASFAEEKLIDECIITIIPTILGEGIKLVLPYEDFTLTHTKSCREGMIQKFYLRKKHED